MLCSVWIMRLFFSATYFKRFFELIQWFGVVYGAYGRISFEQTFDTAVTHGNKLFITFADFKSRLAVFYFIIYLIVFFTNFVCFICNILTYFNGAFKHEIWNFINLFKTIVKIIDSTYWCYEIDHNKYWNYYDKCDTDFYRYVIDDCFNKRLNDSYNCYTA